MRFQNRSEAGLHLVEQLKAYANRDDVCVLALPRGGVPVAFEIARALHAPLDVWVVRKLGAPAIPELAVGAIASGGVQIISSNVVNDLHISPEQLQEIVARERVELERRDAAYRGGRGPVDVREKIAILIDDGIATGSTMRAAIAALRQLQPRQVIAAVPVAARSACRSVETEADSVVCLLTPRDFEAVGEWYVDFSQTTDEQVRELLGLSMQSSPRGLV